MQTVRLLLIVIAALFVAGMGAGLGHAPGVQATHPGDNGKIAYGGAGGIRTINPDGSDDELLIADANSPAWSADGTRIAFARGSFFNADVFVAKADGSEEMLVASGGREPSWSPDGEKLAFARTSGGPGISVVEVPAEGAATTAAVPVPITTNPDGEAEYQPDWSPTGDQIAFCRWEFTEFSAEAFLYIVNANGSGVHKVNTDLKFVHCALSWSPDGTEITLRGVPQSGGEGIYAVGPGGGSPRFITSPHIPGSSLCCPRSTWSPDGERIAFVSSLSNGNYLLRTVASQGGDIQPVIEGEGIDDPAWQPVPNIVHSVEFTQGIQELQTLQELKDSLSGTSDATPQSFPGDNGKIAYAGEGGIRTVNPDGNDDELLIADGRNPAWSADGRRLAFVRGPSASETIWIANADGSGEEQVGSGGTDPAWSPDGDSLVVAVSNGLALVDVSAEGASPASSPLIPLTQNPDELDDFEPDWASTGQIAFCRREFINDSDDTRTFLYVINGDGSGLRKLPRGDLLGMLCGLTWSPDGTEILFVGGTNNAEGLFAINVASGGLRHVLDNRGPVHFPCCPRNSWSPDGERIAWVFQAGLGAPVARVLKTARASDGGDIQTVLEAPGIQDPAWQPVQNIVHGIEFTQAIQELQSLSALESDIEGDGAPPVPIVAGKPAALRIYFSEVDEDTDYIVDTNLHEDDPRVTIKAGCTPKEQRRNDNMCESADVYFVPPEGDWTAEIFIREPGSNEIIQEFTYELTSKRSFPIILSAVAACHAKDTNGIWECGDEELLPGLAASFLGHVAPTDSVRVIDDGLMIARVAGSDGNTWMTRIVNDLNALSLAYVQNADPPDQRIFVGAVMPEAEGGPNGSNGMADQPGYAAVTRTRTDVDGVDRSDSTLAHEVFHSLGVHHTANGLPQADTPGCWSSPDDGASSDWVYPDNFLYSGPEPGKEETGFDVIEGTVKQGDEHFELMSYCAPRWISQRSYMQALDKLDGITTSAAMPAGLTTGDFWLVSGSISDGVAGFSPLYVVEDSSGNADAGTGTHRIEVRGATDDVLFTRHFDPAHSGADIGPGDEQPPETLTFGEAIPLQTGAARIVVLDGSGEIGEIVLTGTPPAVTFDAAPSPAEGEQRVSWTITDADSTTHTSWLEYSDDNGASWTPVVFGLEENEWRVDFDELAGSSSSLLRVRVSDGALTGEATIGPFSVGEKSPQVMIVSPGGGDAFDPGQVVWLQGQADDPEDGPLTGNSIQWTSSRDGNLGVGEALPVTDLSPGTHTLTMTAKDGDNNELADSITITITGASGTDYLWGDADCNGAVAPRDGQAVLASFLQKPPLSQTPPCIAIGTTVTVAGVGSFLWGDVDCNGAVAPRDGQAILAAFLQKPPLSQVGTCPVVGATSTVSGARYVRTE